MTRRYYVHLITFARFNLIMSIITVKKLWVNKTFHFFKVFFLILYSGKLSLFYTYIQKKKATIVMSSVNPIIFPNF